MPAPDPEADQAYLLDHGSVASEMVARLSHTHPTFCIDNATGYSQLVTATLGTSYSAMISPLKRTRNQCGALEALKAQFAETAYWDKQVANMSEFLMNHKWTGETALLLHG